ncbi:Alpha/Beta hydrolase protein [Mycena floridula]|nr:Alpha/Beta hydrolase protein [Mycena floridula]
MEHAPFTVGLQTFQTAYFVYGDLKSKTHRPLVVLHGGPGMSHHYMLPHKELFLLAQIPVVFYDQIGNGESTHLPDALKGFWTPEIFMDELENLLENLGIVDNFDLLGQSWGGSLAGQFAASRCPKGLKRIIIANSPASMKLYQQGTTALLEKFPSDLVKMIRGHESAGTTNSEEYKTGVMQFSKKHVCMLTPWPKELLASFDSIDADPTVYSTMMGASEFCITGTMKEWSIIDILDRIQCPTLLISAPNDSVQLPAVLPWFERVPKLKWVELQDSTHLAMYEEPDRYFAVLLQFLLHDK